MKHDVGPKKATAEAPLAPATAEDGADAVLALLDPQMLGTIPVELTATLGQGRLTMQRLANLSPGEVVPLDTPLNGMVDLSLNGRPIARGEIVSVEDRFGVRITEILVRKA